jgi:hypothetical protein
VEGRAGLAAVLARPEQIGPGEERDGTHSQYNLVVTSIARQETHESLLNFHGNISLMLANFLSLAAERHLNELRDTADQDYLLARIAVRYKLDPQFLWLSHQAVEKYLKLLLIFNGHSAQDVGHDVEALYQQVLAVADLPFGFPPALPGVLIYLALRANRYAEWPYAVSLGRLVDIDQAVWYLRRFCVNLRGNSDRRLQLTDERILADIARRADPRFVRHPASFALTGGYLEDIMRSRTNPLRRHLTWNNLYFSRRRRLDASQSFDRAVNSYLILQPEIISELADRLQFSRYRRRKRKAG